MADDPNYHWDGQRWLHWDGTAWGPSDGPPKPKAARTAFEVWGGGNWANQEIVGESYNATHLQAVAAKHGNPQEIELPAYVVTEPNNQYDSNACAVYVEGGIVGHLPREDASRFAPALATLEALGYAALTKAELRFYDYDDFAASVSICLGEPTELAPVNEPPGGAHAVLPPGKGIQVLDEDAHMDVLAALLSTVSPVSCYVTLVRTEEGTKKPFLRVEIDGRTAGRLSPQMSTAIMPIVDALAARGMTAVARARLEGNQLSAELKVFAMKAAEMSPAQIAVILPPQ